MPDLALDFGSTPRRRGGEEALNQRVATRLSLELVFVGAQAPWNCLHRRLPEPISH